MSTRDEYVAKMKAQLDQWNAQAAHWEEKTRSAQAGVKAHYDKQLELLRARRDEAMTSLRQLQVATSDAWMDMMQGVDAAWQALGEAFDKAHAHFERRDSSEGER